MPPFLAPRPNRSMKTLFTAFLAADVNLARLDVAHASPGFYWTQEPGTNRKNGVAQSADSPDIGPDARPAIDGRLPWRTGPIGARFVRFRHATGPSPR